MGDVSKWEELCMRHVVPPHVLGHKLPVEGNKRLSLLPFGRPVGCSGKPAQGGVGGGSRQSRLLHVSQQGDVWREVERGREREREREVEKEREKEQRRRRRREEIQTQANTGTDRQAQTHASVTVSRSVCVISSVPTTATVSSSPLKTARKPSRSAAPPAPQHA